jgi:hypothetical protein
MSESNKSKIEIEIDYLKSEIESFRKVITTIQSEIDNLIFEQKKLKSTTNHEIYSN